MKLLVTGGAGFVGSSMAIQIKTRYPAYTVYALDNLKRRGSELNLSRLRAAGINFVHGDIRSKADFDSLDLDFTHIIEASAEPSVLAGLTGSPDYLIETNLFGSVHCLNFAKRCGAVFIFLSTSRVYSIEKLEKCLYTEEQTRFTLTDNQQVPGVSAKGVSEDFSLNGYRSFYGATKLASELLIQEYNHFYGLRTIVNRCGVLTGPWQMGKADQGILVLWMAKHYWKKKLAYIGYGGEGKQVRDVLHVNDLFRLVDHQLHNPALYNGSTFNVGGGLNASVSLQELSQICSEITGNLISIDKIKENRQADIRAYITDNSRIEAVSGWRPEITVKEILIDIFTWINENQTTLKDILA